MKTIKSIPENDKYYFPAEFSKHKGTIIIWPERPGSWPFGAKKARIAFAEIIKELLKSEIVYVIVNDRTEKSAQEALPKEAILINIDTDDSWARDIAPTFVTNNKTLRGVNWAFNAWGGEYDGLYADYEKDNAFAKTFCSKINCNCYDAAPFVLEGGSIHTDGEGTLLVTESCLLSEGRNPNLTKEQIEDKLKNYLSVEKIIWLPRGIFNDETNEHVDNIACFSAPGEVILAWTDDKNDPQYEMSLACEKVLNYEKDAKGRKIKIHKLPIPEKPICITEDDLKGYVFEQGEDKREIGERLAASYVNFYIANDVVLVPQFGGENVNSDKKAIEILSNIFRTRRVVGIDAISIILGGGNIHCITQQIPEGEYDEQ